MKNTTNATIAEDNSASYTFTARIVHRARTQIVQLTTRYVINVFGLTASQRQKLLRRLPVRLHDVTHRPLAPSVAESLHSSFEVGQSIPAPRTSVVSSR